MGKFWLAVAGSDVSSILHDGYHVKRRTHVPLAAHPEGALGAISALKDPVLLQVNVSNCEKLKRAGDGYHLHVKHWPASNFKRVNTTKALLHRIGGCMKRLMSSMTEKEEEIEEKKVLEEENDELEEKKQSLETRCDKLVKQRNQLKNRLQMERNELERKCKLLEGRCKMLSRSKTESEELNKTCKRLHRKKDQMTKMLEEKDAELEEVGETLRRKKRKLNELKKQVQEEISDILNDMQEDVAEELDAHFKELPEELLETGPDFNSEDEARLTCEVRGCMRRICPNTANVSLEEPELHEINEITDLTTKFIKKEHDVELRVARVLKIRNDRLRRMFEKGKQELLGEEPNIKMKFHGTTTERAAQILEKGFIIPEKPGMYGRGIYFATDSTKSALYTHKKELGILLVCQVAMGQIWTLESRNDKLTKSRIHEKGFDSVYAPRDTKDTGGVYNDEFVVYSKKQVLPTFVVLVKQFANVENRKLESINETVANTLENATLAVVNRLMSRIEDISELCS